MAATKAYEVQRLKTRAAAAVAELVQLKAAHEETVEALDYLVDLINEYRRMMMELAKVRDQLQKLRGVEGE